ncbi:TRAP transporter small permease [Sneathiella sp.]|uniref:TRAP transporter small permease n=1 Tax=Sneathiella sp. TaxID=1964365 RepID=UPI003567D874
MIKIIHGKSKSARADRKNEPEKWGGYMLEISEKIVNLCARLLMVLGCVAMTMMMLHVMSEVFLRYFFTASIPGTEEIVSGYYMVAVVFLPLGYVQLERGHIIIELFTLKVSERGKAWMDGVVLTVCSAALAIFAYAGFDKAINMTIKNEIWIGMVDVSIWPARWMLPVGLTVMTLMMVVQCIREFQFAVTGKGAIAHRHIEDSERV